MNMNPKIIEEESINIYELKQELSKIKKRDEELSIRTNKTDEYIKSFAVLTIKDSQDLKKKLEELHVPRLKDTHINKIIDVLPESVDELKVLLQGYVLSVTKDNLSKIVKTVKEFVPEKA